MLQPWLEFDEAAEHLARYAEASGADLQTHGTTSDEETIRDTAVAQPLLAAGALISAGALGLTPDKLPAYGDSVLLAGHSVGEIPAAALAGVISDTTAMELIGIRGRAMAEAAAAEPTGMAAVLGGTEDDVLTAIENAGLSPANVNGAGQIVAAGSTEGITTLSENPPAKARVIPLKVAGAFHTSYMAPAEGTLAQAAQRAETAAPVVRLVSNRDGAAVSTGDEALSRIVQQVTRPVRWDACMQSMGEAGVTGVLELLPGGTLSGLLKRGLKGTKTFAVKSPEDLSAAAEFIEEHTA